MATGAKEKPFKGKEDVVSWKGKQYTKEQCVCGIKNGIGQ